MANEEAKTAVDLNMELMEASDKCELERVQELLRSGASAAFIHDPPGTWGSCSKRGPLHLAIRRKPRQQKDEAEAEYRKREANWHAVITTLVEAKADVNAVCAEYDWRGCGSTSTAFELILPAALKDVGLLSLFLDAGADANTRSEQSIHSMRTDGCCVHYVLHQAVGGQSLEVVRALLDAGADVNAEASERISNERGYDQDRRETALHQSCGAGREPPNLAMCALLLARGARVDAVRTNLDHVESGVESPTDDPRDDGYESPVVCVRVQETALHIALRRKDTNLVVMLVCAGADKGIKRVRGGEECSCEDLCGGDTGLLEALRAEWTPETHKLFPESVRKSVEAALLIAHRQKWNLPDSLLFKVCALAASPTQTAPATD